MKKVYLIIYGGSVFQTNILFEKRCNIYLCVFFILKVLVKQKFRCIEFKIIF